jgi:hypothetical protein
LLPSFVVHNPSQIGPQGVAAGVAVDKRAESHEIMTALSYIRDRLPIDGHSSRKSLE